MAETGKRRRLTPNDRRAEILVAARALFAERGLSEVSVSQVIARAGLSKGGFYHHFDTKEALVAQVVAEFAEEVLAAALPVLSQPGPALDCLNAFFATAITHKLNARDDVQIASDAVTTASADELLREVRARVQNQMRDAFVRLVERGRAEGAFQPVDAEIVADCIFAFERSRLAAYLRSKSLPREEATALMLERSRAESRTLDRLLGLPDGSISYGTETEFRAVMAGVKTSKE